MKKENKSATTVNLRLKAEDMLKRKLSKSGLLDSEAEKMKLIQELIEHLMELELLNKDKEERAAELLNENNEFRKLILDCKQTELALLESEAKYKTMVTQSPDGFFIMDLSGTFLSVNKSMCDILKYTEKEFLSMKIWEIVPKQFQFLHKQRLLEIMKGEILNSNAEYEIKGKDGIIHAIEVRSAPFYKEKELIGFQGIAHDITEQKKSENAMIASETRYRRLFESAKDGILILDAETGKIVDVNPFLIELLGYSKEAFLEKEIWEIGFFKDIIANQDKFLELQQQEYVRYDNLPLETANGRKINVEFVSNVYLVNNKKVIQCNIRDITERKQVENALINSEASLHMLVQTIPDLIWTKDVNGNYLSCNTMFERFFGAKEADIIGKTDYDFVDRELADFFREYDRNAMVVGMPTSNEEWITFADDGHRAYLETIKAPIYDIHNRLIGVLGIGRDMTDRKNAEEALQESLERYKKLTLISPVGIFHADKNGVTTFVNPKWCSISGLSFEDALGDGWLNAVHPDDKEKLFKGWKEATLNQDISISDYRFLRPDGTIAWVMGQAIPETNTEGKTVGYIGTITDITERKLSEEKLKGNNKFLQTILNAIPTPVFYKDLEGRYTGFNKAFEMFFGKTTQELVGKTAFDINPPEFAKIYHAKDMELFNSPGKQVYDAQMKDSQGVIHEVVYHKATFQDSSGKTSGLIGVILDITERKKATDELKEKNAFIQIVLDNLPIGISLNKIDSSSSIYFNKKFEEIYGWPKAEMKDMDGFFGKVYPDRDYREQLTFRIISDIQSGDSSRMHWEDCIIKHKDGSTHIINAVNIPLFDQNTMVSTVLDVTERKLAESLLRDSEEKYRTFFENSMDAILLTSPDGSMLSANEAACNMFGYTKEEFIKLGRSGIIDTSDHRLSILLAERKLNGKTKGEITLVRKDGTPFPAEISSAIFINAEGFERTSMIIHDITERMNAEKEITMLAQSLRSVNELVTITDIDNKILFVNDSFLKTYGYHLDELIGKNINLIQSKKNVREHVDEILPATILGEWKGELFNTRKDGSEFPIFLSTSIIKDKEGETLGLIGVATDITERKRAEKELIVAKEKAEKNELSIREQNEEIELNNNRLESLLKVSQFSPVSIQELLDFALNEIISLTNSKIGYIYFYNESTQQFILNTWSKEVMTECQVKNQQTIYDLDKTGCWGEAVRQRKPIVINDYNKENIFKKGYPEGHVKLNKFLTIPVFFENMIVAVAGVANKSSDYDNTDIRQLTLMMDNVWKYSERITLIENLKLAKEKAEESDKLKTAFLQNMSHEIRTPMNAIVGFSELMVLEIDEPDKLKYYTKVIRQRSEDLLGIINDLLDISRIEAGQLFFKPEQVDLNKLFEELHSLFSVHNLQIEKSSINLKVNEVPSDLNSIVSTDGGKLKQILSNLIHNAFKFTTEGEIKFGFHSISNNNITFFVSDSGPGISINMKDLIFERFRKSADESVYAQDGMGLGLAIVKGLLKLFNGEIRVESELNKGSTFYFTIPYLPLSIEKVPEITANKQALDWSKFTLLIVEDDKFNIAYFNEILKSTGVKLLIGETGNQAISLFTNNQNIDLVLMDIKLPDMSGYDVTKKFKHFRPEIPIIAQTAYVVDADKQKALDAGCDFFITKPIQRSILLETINKYLIPNLKE